MAEIEFKRVGAVAHILINRPERKNALAGDMRAQLAEAFLRAHVDDEVRAVLLTGAGDSFCAGADVSKMAPRDVKDSRMQLQQNAHVLIRNLYNIEKPVIAAVRGIAVGIGLSMMLACDLVVASETAKFSCIFARRGLAPDSGAVFFLSRAIGMARARELVFSTRFFSAQEAAALDLVTRVVPDDALEREALELAEAMAAQPTYALAMAKKMFQFSLSPSLDQFLEMEALIQPQIRQTADFQEGVASFKEKRPARFVGR
ncbi:enoyl-CoA hydratase/isomerase family protein [Candidimonas nitroreducens]|uniref:Enoyl-CoA hydratase n=1 Tax=Candidimonas nitroreducens TaxID=683354 RepID=A0A225MCW1_9BURK|nr:enoyl-CoA hydratase-related protein [Candidimonas nitroreducens]OWT59048.1 enoyl-CoA hydratase [Candidimonas nitroreducens]